MSAHGTSSKGDSHSPLDRLRHEVIAYVSKRGQYMVGNLTEKLKDVADPSRLLPTDGDGSLAGAAARVVKGENPVKAFIAGKTKGVKDKVVDKAKASIGSDGDGGKAGDLKAVNIVEHVDIGRPLRVVYNTWTQLEDFGSFTNGVSNVRMDEEDETKSQWKVRVWPSTRSWDATVEEQVPDERIVWNSEGAKGTTHGAVSFHPLEENLTRVVAVVEYYPSGFFERVGNVWRAQGRRLRLDLKHFQRYVTFQTEEAEGWRGEIRDGEVVRSHEDVLRDEEGDRMEHQEPEEDGEENDEREEGGAEGEGERRERAGRRERTERRERSGDAE